MKAHGSLSLVNKESRGFRYKQPKEGSEINERRKKVSREELVVWIRRQ